MANQMDQLYADGRCLKNSILAGTDSGAGLEIGPVRFAQILWLHSSLVSLVDSPGVSFLYTCIARPC